MLFRLMRLLKEYIELALNERIRGKREFKLSEFKQIEKPYLMIAYCHDVLVPLGEGSSRVVYVLSSSKVLKIANPNREEAGIDQNGSEVSISKNSETSQHVAKVFDHDPSMKWVISELVRPINQNDFKREFGIGPSIIFSAIREMVASGNANVDDFLAKRPKIAKLLTPEAKSFTETCVKLSDVHDLIVADLVTLDHWGKTADGRIVLLDYGFNSRVYDKHYKIEIDKDSPTVRPE
jgi:hypothetical protein